MGAARRFGFLCSPDATAFGASLSSSVPRGHLTHLSRWTEKKEALLGVYRVRRVVRPILFYPRASRLREVLGIFLDRGKRRARRSERYGIFLLSLGRVGTDHRATGLAVLPYLVDVWKRYVAAAAACRNPAGGGGLELGYGTAGYGIR